MEEQIQSYSERTAVLKCKIYGGTMSIMDVCPEQSQPEDWRAFYDTTENCAMDQQEQFVNGIY
jgi:hypothetical protein